MDFTNFYNNFLNSIGEFLPGVLGAIFVLLIGWLIAITLRSLTQKILKKTDLDNKLFSKGASTVSPEKFLAKLVYYLIMLLVLLVVLEMLGVHNVLDPVKNLVNEFVLAIPKIIKAGIIGFAGYVIAKIASEFVELAAGFFDSLSEKMGLESGMDISKIAKQIVFLLVFIPVVILALDTLELKAISDPAREMLSTFMSAIPNIIAAVIIIALFYFVGKYLKAIGAELLRNLGTDKLSEKLNLGNIIGEKQSLSNLIANTGFFFLMFTGIIAAVEKLHFNQLSIILNDLLELSGHIFFGLIIMAVGNFISSIAYKALESNNEFLASVARVATLGLFLAIALRTMGIANDIVSLAFGLTLGAVAVAVALSFGLGGREAAGKQMEYIFKKFRNEE